MPALRRRWAKSLIHSTPELIVAAFECFISAGSANPPTLPEFRRMVDDLHKQEKLQRVYVNKNIDGKQSSEIADYYKMCIKRILKIKEGNESFPWIAKIEDATEEQLDAIRRSMSMRGIQVKAFAEYV